MDKYQSRFTGVEIDARLAKVNQEFTLEEKEKLSGLVNYDDTEVWEVLETRVEKVEGKGLSSNDFTDDDKSKLEELQTSKANASDVYTKTETDSAITAKVSEIVAGAPEEFDTLKEMSDWLTEHEDSAAAMNTAIQKNATDIANRYTKTESDKKYLGKTETAAAAVLDGAGGNIAEQFAAVKNEIAVNRATLGIQRVNIFDGEIIAGQIDVDTGGVHETTNAVMSKNFIKVSRNAIVSIKRTESTNYMTWRFYDENKNYIGAANSETIELIIGANISNVLAQNTTFGCFKVLDPDIRYIRFNDNTNSLTNEYTFVEGVYTKDTMPTYAPYVPNVVEQIAALVTQNAKLESRIADLESAVATTAE